MASKYRNQSYNGYASKREANRAVELHILEKAGIICDLKEQVKVQLIPDKGNVRGVAWIADFTYRNTGSDVLHYEDVKGFRTDVYKLKKRIAYLLLGITIEEV